MKTFEAKQLWLRRIMESRLKPAQKIFAWAIFDHMYGDKISSFPKTEDLERRSGLSRSKFTSHRTALFEAGALTGDKTQRRGQWENYTYTLNLDWGGQVPDRAPAGAMDHVPSGGTDHVPSGSSNTSIEDIKGNTSNKPGAVAPVVREEVSSLPKTDKTTEVSLPSTSSNSSDGAVGVVTSIIPRAPTGSTAYTQEEVQALVEDSSWGTVWRNPVVRMNEARKQLTRVAEAKANG